MKKTTRNQEVKTELNADKLQEVAGGIELASLSRLTQLSAVTDLRSLTSIRFDGSTLGIVVAN